MWGGEIKSAMITLAPFVPLVYRLNFCQAIILYLWRFSFTVVSIDLLKAWGPGGEQAPLGVLYYLAGTGRLEKERKD